MKRRATNSNTTSTTIPSPLEQFAAEQKESDFRVRELSAENRILTKTNAELIERVALLESIDNIVPRPPKWTQPPERKGAIHQGMPTMFLSDVHLDEVVKPEQIEGVNCYNREIAIKRLKRVKEGLFKVTRKYIAGLQYPGLNLLFGGDMFSGNIHEELKETNEDTMLGSLDFWLNHLCTFVGECIEEYGHVHFAGCVGNHGRNTRKPIHKNRVRDNFDWFLYRMIARYFEKDSRITFQIEESPDCEFKLYNTTYRLTHGDQFSGGSGISGALAPLMLGNARKRIRQMSLDRPYDWMLIGHFHTYWSGLGILVNGSVKGYEQYAYDCNFPYDRPKQAFFVTTPEHGLTFPMPIFADKREDEGW